MASHRTEMVPLFRSIANGLGVRADDLRERTHDAPLRAMIDTASTDCQQAMQILSLSSDGTIDDAPRELLMKVDGLLQKAEDLLTLAKFRLTIHGNVP